MPIEIIRDIATGQLSEREIPLLPLDEARLAKWEQVKALRDQYENGGVTVPGVGTFQSDPISRGYINGAVMMAQIAIGQSLPYAISWTLADNSVAVLDAPGMIAVGFAVGQHVAAGHANAQALRVLIEAAEDRDALDLIDITEGWS